MEENMTIARQQGMIAGYQSTTRYTPNEREWAYSQGVLVGQYMIMSKLMPTAEAKQFAYQSLLRFVTEADDNKLGLDLKSLDQYRIAR
jgi:hypothetical protein